MGTKREKDGRNKFAAQGDFRNLQCQELRQRRKGQGQGSRSWSSRPTAQDGRGGFVARTSSPPMVAKAVDDLILLNQQVWILGYPYNEGVPTYIPAYDSDGNRGAEFSHLSFLVRGFV